MEIPWESRRGSVCLNELREASDPPETRKRRVPGVKTPFDFESMMPGLKSRPISETSLPQPVESRPISEASFCQGVRRY